MFMSEEQKRIYVTHVNIRLSIFFLLLKLIAIEFFAGTLIVFWHLSMAVYVKTVETMQLIVQYGIPILIFLVTLKLFITGFIIMQWLNEYYEISATKIIYRRGILFRKADDYPIHDIKFIEVDQGFFGQMFNFGTVTLLNLRRVKYAEMYLIHNPLRYARVVEELVPGLVEKKKLIRRHYHEDGNEDERKIEDPRTEEDNNEEVEE
jgi:membrane protein YdbS with pleckstrin-like domain